MDAPAPTPETRALVATRTPVLSHSARRPRSVASRHSGPWQAPDDYLRPEQARAVIGAAATQRYRLLLRALWASGGRVSEVLGLRAIDVRRDALMLPNLKNPGRRTKTVYLSGSDADLPGQLLPWQREAQLAPDAPLFFSRKRGPDGELVLLSRGQVKRIVELAGRRAQVSRAAVRDSNTRHKGDPGPVYPHAFRHARVRQIMRTTRSLPLAQRQAGGPRCSPPIWG
jgi:integrase